jgi:hypothetical protein
MKTQDNSKEKLLTIIEEKDRRIAELEKQVEWLSLLGLFDRNLLILFDRPFCPLALSACDADRALMSTNSILPQQ